MYTEVAWRESQDAMSYAGIFTRYQCFFSEMLSISSQLWYHLLTFISHLSSSQRKWVKVRASCVYACMCVFVCVCFVIGMELKSLCFLGKHSYHWVIPPTPPIPFCTCLFMCQTFKYMLNCHACTFLCVGGGDTCKTILHSLWPLRKWQW
jgi:hypothetical protein